MIWFNSISTHIRRILNAAPVFSDMFVFITSCCSKSKNIKILLFYFRGLSLGNGSLVLESWLCTLLVQILFAIWKLKTSYIPYWVLICVLSSIQTWGEQTLTRSLSSMHELRASKQALIQLFHIRNFRILFVECLNTVLMTFRSRSNCWQILLLYSFLNQWINFQSTR